MTEVTFQFYALTFTPYKENKQSHNDLAKTVLRHLQNERKNKSATMVDRYENRDGPKKRELYLNSIYEMPPKKGGRFRGSVALLRDGARPKIKPDDTFDLEDIKKSGTLTELTHFFVDFSKAIPIVCMQYNHHGPRAKDLEYYLRQIAHKYMRVAKSTKLTFFMDRPIEEVVDNLRYVLSFSVKVRPKNFARIQQNLEIGSYYSSMNQIGNEYKPKYLKIDASFHAINNKRIDRKINKKANSFVIDNLLNFKRSESDIYLFDNFEVEYEDKDGEDILFSLFKGKKEFTKEIDVDKIESTKDHYNLIKADFDDFIENYEN